MSAALLAEAGYHVEVVCKHPELAEKIKTKGIHITGVKGEIIVTLPAVAAIPEIKEKKDIFLLSTKANDLSRAAE
jgi:ketopantoate reductase